MLLLPMVPSHEEPEPPLKGKLKSKELLERVRAYAEEAGLTVGPAYTPRGRVSARSLIVNGKRCRIYHTSYLQEPQNREIRRYAKLPEIPQTILESHDVLVILVEIEEGSFSYKQFFAVPMEVFVGAEFDDDTRPRIPLTDKNIDRTDPKLDWQKYAGQRCFLTLKGQPRDWLML